MIPGAEFMVDPVGGPMCPEFLAIGIDEVPEEPNGDPAHWYPYENCVIKTFATLDDGAAFVEGFGGASVLCHPSWSGLPQTSVFAASGMHGMEIWNASAHRENDRGDSSYVWDLASDAGLSFAPFATDDSHYPAFDVGDAWTMVRAAERTRDAVVAAVRAGFVYASNGPSILDVERDGDVVEALVSPAHDVWLHGAYEDGLALSAGPRGRREDGQILERDDRGLITRVRFTPSATRDAGDLDRRWWRLVVADGGGRRAWSGVI
jgi:hypothetical protein